MKRILFTFTAAFVAAVVFVIMLYAVVVILCRIIPEHTETRKINGMTATEYTADDGKQYMTVITEDGLYWDIENFRASFFSPCTVTFNTNGTKTTDDDTIISINVYTKFIEGDDF